MADIIESEVFESGIYQLEITDPVLGGENGISNRQAKQLANRTKWLKAKIDLILGGTFEAAKAVVLKTARKINGVDFDGSANITLPTVNTSGDQEVLGIKNFTDGVKVKGENVSPFSGFKNYIINGNFDVWQYAPSQTSNGYGSDDRWNNAHNGSTKTHSMVACTDIERALFNASKFSRTVVSSVTGSSNFVHKSQTIEDVTRLAGKTVTLSFWAKADAAKPIGLRFQQFFGTGGTPSAGVDGIGAQLVDLTTTWQKFSITVDIPSIIGKTLGTDGVHTSGTFFSFGFDMGDSVSYYYGGLGQQSGTFDIAQVQLEEGPFATPFELRPPGIELSLCQRYFLDRGYSTNSIRSNRTPVYSVYSDSLASNKSICSAHYPVKMRVAPTVRVGNVYNGSGTLINATGVSAWNTGGLEDGATFYNTSGSIITTNQQVVFINWDASAEL